MYIIINQFAVRKATFGFSHILKIFLKNTFFKKLVKFLIEKLFPIKAFKLAKVYNYCWYLNIFLFFTIMTINFLGGFYPKNQGHHFLFIKTFIPY